MVITGKGPVIRTTFFVNLSCNIVALQVETRCAYFIVWDRLVLQQKRVLQNEPTSCAR